MYPEDEENTRGLASDRARRLALTKLVLRLFDLWQLGVPDQLALLGCSLGTLKKYKAGQPIGNRKDRIDRIGYLLAIHGLLRTLYPARDNRDIVHSWVTWNNQCFGCPPVYMMGTLEGLQKVVRYLQGNTIL